MYIVVTNGRGRQRVEAIHFTWVGLGSRDIHTGEAAPVIFASVIPQESLYSASLRFFCTAKLVNSMMAGKALDN